MSVTTAFSRSVRRAPRNTLAPLNARRRAVDSPRPLLAPVMTTTFPSMLDIVLSLFRRNRSLNRVEGHFRGVWSRTKWTWKSSTAWRSETTRIVIKHPFRVRSVFIHANFAPDLRWLDFLQADPFRALAEFRAARRHLPGELVNGVSVGVPRQGWHGELRLCPESGISSRRKNTS